MKQNRTALSAVVALSAALALSACSPPNEKATGTEHIDTATVGAKTPELGDKTDKKADSDTTESATQESTESATGSETEAPTEQMQPGIAGDAEAGNEPVAGAIN